MVRLDGEYDPNNVFARILRGELPCAKVWEDDRALVLMDAFPQTPGHVLVIPKTGSRNLLDTPADTLAHLIAVTQRVARAVVQALGADGFRIMQFNGASAGQTVPHVHFHILPMQDGETPRPHAGGGPAAPDELAALAGRIARAMD